MHRATLRHLNIEVTASCNQACVYCFNDSAPGREHTRYSLAQWRSILASMRTCDLQSVHVTGGEPFTWRYTPALLRSAQALGVATSILSNGTRIVDLVAGAERSVMQGLVLAQISLDSPDPDTHDRRRGRQGAHATAMAAIRALLDLDVPVQISAVVDGHSVGDVPALAELARTLGTGLLLRPLQRLGRATSMNPAVPHPGLAHGEQDPFHYVPTTPEHDATRALDGAATVHPDGTLRGLLMAGQPISLIDWIAA